jgi:hypothetical protein
VTYIFVRILKALGICWMPHTTSTDDSRPPNHTRSTMTDWQCPWAMDFVVTSASMASIIGHDG